MVKIEKVYLE